MLKKCFSVIVLTSLLCALLLFPDIALKSARRGLDLWFETLVPTLLPFLILSGFLIHSGLIRLVTLLIHPLLGRILGLSPNGSFACITGFLLGCPAGAKILGDLSSNQLIDQREGQYLLSFCCNLSPSFVITYLIQEQLHAPGLTGPILLILYGLPLLIGLILNPFYRAFRLERTDIKNASEVQISFELLDACIYDAVHTLLKLGGYLVLFSVVSGILTKLPVPTSVCGILCGGLEITGGIPEIIKLFSFSQAMKILLPLTAFGGLSILAQTSSVLKGSQLSARFYLFSKLLQTALTLLIVLFGKVP